MIKDQRKQTRLQEPESLARHRALMPSDPRCEHGDSDAACWSLAQVTTVPHRRESVGASLSATDCGLVGVQVPVRIKTDESDESYERASEPEREWQLIGQRSKNASIELASER
jgi:hypothetical protein